MVLKFDVPCFRPDLGELELAEVVAALRYGWLTAEPGVRRFEEEFAAAVGAPYAVAVNSSTAALYLAVEALALKTGQAAIRFADALERYLRALRQRRVAAKISG